jgi:hypothetical protein
VAEVMLIAFPELSYVRHCGQGSEKKYDFKNNLDSASRDTHSVRESDLPRILWIMTKEKYDKFAF